MKFRLALVRGDGIGPEVISAAEAALRRLGEVFGHSFAFEEVLAGGCAIDETGEPLPAESVRICKECGVVLLGAVGGPKWDGLPGNKRPEQAILGLRKELGLYANLRPARLSTALAAASPLHPDIARRGIDLVIVRELCGGIYYGERGRRQAEGGEEAYDTECYSETEIERIGRKAFELAMGRARRLVSVDKANVLESSRLWREVMHRLAGEFPAVEYRDMYVDNAAMQLVRDPGQFDVLVTSNLFGDILSDEASALIGSIGLLPSCSAGGGGRALYEPIHGSAPELAGKGAANPLGAILSAAMLLRNSFSLPEEAACLESAVDRVLRSGLRTADLAGDPAFAVSTQAMTEGVLAQIGAS
jgi:3-isopropylmalate dehydrogenase